MRYLAIPLLQTNLPQTWFWQAAVGQNSHRPMAVTLASTQQHPINRIGLRQWARNISLPSNQEQVCVV